MCNNQNNGWIKLFRNFTKWEWYSDSESVHLFLHLLLKGNKQKCTVMKMSEKRKKFLSRSKTKNQKP